MDCEFSGPARVRGSDLDRDFSGPAGVRGSELDCDFSGPAAVRGSELDCEFPRPAAVRGVGFGLWIFTCGVAQQLWVQVSKYRVHSATSSFVLFLLRSPRIILGLRVCHNQRVAFALDTRFHFHLFSLIFWCSSA